MRYRFFTCDVFTTVRFCGNQLAVLPDAQGLSDAQMQQIAREFNYAETSFVFPAAGRYARAVRIYSPTMELPFAGHPNIGTAYTLASEGEFGDIGTGITVTFTERAGLVPVAIRRDGHGLIWCELAAPQRLSLGKSADPAMVAMALSLELSDIETAGHLPMVASVGLPYLFVELASRAALQRARAQLPGFQQLRAAGIVTDLHLYVRSKDEFDIRTRQFSPLDAVAEDAATGSANCALAALLTNLEGGRSSGGSWRIAQGVEMGRPSILQARTRRDGGQIDTWIGGHCVPVSAGFLQAD